MVVTRNIPFNVMVWSSNFYPVCLSTWPYLMLCSRKQLQNNNVILIGKKAPSRDLGAVMDSKQGFFDGPTNSNAIASHNMDKTIALSSAVF